MEGPDFICVGMPKAGTGWLSDQLRHHPDFWMPPVQEIGYLGRDVPALRRATNILSRLKNKPERIEKILSNRHGTSEAELRFLEEMAALAGQPRDIERYISLFRHKGDLKSGDVSPGYSMMDEEVIAEISRRLPELRVVLLLRDPIARLWSHISMWSRNGKFEVEVLRDADKFRAYLRSTKMAGERSSPSNVVAHWQRAAPALKFRYFFFDDIAERPDDARRDILSFLDVDPGRKSGELPPSYNRKSNAAKLEMSGPLKAILVEHYSAEIRAAAAHLGGPAKSWATRYGI